MSELVKDEEHSQQQRMENGVNEEDEDAVVALPDSESEAEDDGIDAQYEQTHDAQLSDHEDLDELDQSAGSCRSSEEDQAVDQDQHLQERLTGDHQLQQQQQQQQQH